MKKKILLQSAPFCFGPSSTLLNIAQHLINDYELVMIDEGPTAELLKLSGLDIQSIKISTTSPSKKLDELLGNVDAVISNTDLEFAEYCHTQGIKKLIVIDTLFWMWDKIDPVLYNCDLYIVQNFFGTDIQLKRSGAPKNILIVGPLVNFIEDKYTLQKREQILISLGGCDCTLFDQKKDPFPQLIIELIQEAFDRITLKNFSLIVTVGTQTRNSLINKFGNIEIKTLSNIENQRLMREVRAILLSPGITGTFEAINTGTPIFFLPPQNYSQLLQLNELKKFGAAPFCFNWNEAYPSFFMPQYLPEADAVNRLRNIVNNFITDYNAQKLFKHKLTEFKNSGLNGYYTNKPMELLNKFGVNGLTKAINAIFDVIET